MQINWTTDVLYVHFLKKKTRLKTDWDVIPKRTLVNVRTTQETQMVREREGSRSLCSLSRQHLFHPAFTVPLKDHPGAQCVFVCVGVTLALSVCVCAYVCVGVFSLLWDT